MIPLALMVAVLAPLTPDGWGKVRIGMTRRQVEQVLPARLKGEPIVDEKECLELVPTGPDRGMTFLFEEYRLSRISISKPSKIVTPRGVGVGATAAEVRKAYPGGLLATKNYYDDLPAEYLTYWNAKRHRGVRFETDQQQRVYVVHAGTGSIEFVEGCA